MIPFEFKIAGEMQRSKATTHTVKLTLKPVTSQGGIMQVSDSGTPEPL